MSVTGICRDVERFLRGLAGELPDVFPRRPVYRRVVRRARVPKPTPAERAHAKAVINTRVTRWAGELGLEFNRVTVKSQRSLWGSCSRKGNLNFNWRLSVAPPEMLDYVVIHELCHLREMNHSKNFWAHVAAACPDFKARRKWLRANTAALLGLAPAANTLIYQP